MVQKILVPHDGYKISDKALKFAIEIAKAMHMEIIILRVLPYAMEDSTLALFDRKKQTKITRDLRQINKEVRYHIYNKLAEQLATCTSAGVKATRMVVMGLPVEEILSVAQKEKPYMIIMGSRRLRGFGKLKVLGSVAKGVSEEAKCPVTIVH